MLTLVLLPTLILAIALGKRSIERHQRRAERSYRNDVKVKQGAQVLANCLNEINLINTQLRRLHIAYNSCLAASAVSPAGKAPCQAIRTSIVAVGTAARFRVITCSTVPGKNNITVTRLPWRLWWLQFKTHRDRVHNLPLYLAPRRLKINEEFEISLRDNRFSSKGTFVYCGHTCTSQEWVFGK